MTQLEQLRRGIIVRGVLPHRPVTVVEVTWHGHDVISLIYRDEAGEVQQCLLYRHQEPQLSLVTEGQPWSFEADGQLLRLVSEAQRIRLAHLFDPYLAIHTSRVEPLPHQITAVYGHMVPRQPLRFLLADDPGAGKTIMAGLLIKELLIRGDLRRCLIVCPGSLVDQWQEELHDRFALRFEFLDWRYDDSVNQQPFQRQNLVIARLDRLARNEDLLQHLRQTDWDLIVCDEAHKMSASFFGGEIKYTKRYRLGQLLAQLSRHFLLMTATPHNGKEEEFQLFMALLDGDRFEGRFREGVHQVDTSDLMRRLVKEQLLRFDGRPLFPERRAYTVSYQLSDLEAELYQQVTDYVRQEFNRAEALDNNRRGTVGFALTILQRRLASSPEAIYQSLRRRRQRLTELQSSILDLSWDQLAGELAPSAPESDDDLADLTGEEQERLSDLLVDQSTAAQTVEELEIEIAILAELEAMAGRVRRSQRDHKWEQLSKLLQNQTEMFDEAGQRRKLVIFTEHRDTLTYLVARVRALLGRPEAVVVIHGGTRRSERRQAQAAFTQDSQVQVLIATDAAGEGINLQRAHLMINYDLPWNPNRLEQRFGRIHRIGQTEVCHLWNLVAEGTREGDVYLTLLRKLEQARQSLGGAVFDVLGRAIDGTELRQLMMEAIRQSDQPTIKARLNRVTASLEPHRLRELMADYALSQDMMTLADITQIRQEMDRLQAQRLQPHFITAFFQGAWQQIGGSLHQREGERFEITHVPASLRHRQPAVSRSEPILPRYDRVCFKKEQLDYPGQPPAALICPGHPLLDATIDLILERHRDVLKQGAILVAEEATEETLRLLFYLQHSIQDGRPESRGDHRNKGDHRLASQRLQFVELELLMTDPGQPPRPGSLRDAGSAPYLDYRPLTPTEQAVIAPVIAPLRSDPQFEQQAIQYAIQHIVPQHVTALRQLKEPLIDKTYAAVKERLTKEIIYWDQRVVELQSQEAAGRVNARLNSARAKQRVDELAARLDYRLQELAQERQLIPLPPVVIGGALIVPAGLLARLQGQRHSPAGQFAAERKRIELAAMAAVMQAERALGYQPRDVSDQNLGYDIESVTGAPLGAPTSSRPTAHRDAGAPGETGTTRFIEVKGKLAGKPTVTITRNELMRAKNSPHNWILALVQVPPAENLPADVTADMVQETKTGYQLNQPLAIRYVAAQFVEREPGFAEISVNFDFKSLWQVGQPPGEFFD